MRQAYDYWQDQPGSCPRNNDARSRGTPKGPPFPARHQALPSPARFRLLLEGASDRIIDGYHGQLRPSKPPLRRRPNPRRFSSKPVLWVISANRPTIRKCTPSAAAGSNRTSALQPRRSFQPNVPSREPETRRAAEAASPAGYSLIELCVRFRIANLHKLPLLAPAAALLRAEQLAPRA